MQTHSPTAPNIKTKTKLLLVAYTYTVTPTRREKQFAVCVETRRYYNRLYYFWGLSRFTLEMASRMLWASRAASYLRIDRNHCIFLKKKISKLKIP